MIYYHDGCHHHGNDFVEFLGHLYMKFPHNFPGFGMERDQVDILFGLFTGLKCTWVSGQFCGNVLEMYWLCDSMVGQQATYERIHANHGIYWLETKIFRFLRNLQA